jgi:urea transport system ATP-binding protein
MISPTAVDVGSEYDKVLSHSVYLKDVVVSFDGFKALDVKEFAVHFNDLRVVIGSNGAGKTTLCDVISGKTRVKTGKVYFNRAEVTHEPDIEIARRGVGRKFQTPTVFDSLTVYENMELALPGRRGVWRNLLARRSRSERDRILPLLRRVHLADDLHTEARYLSHGQRQWLEISMLIVAEPKLLLVDEPAAGLTDRETELTAELLLELRGQHTIIVIEHDMEFVRRLDARVTVLNEGRVLAEGSMQEVQSHPDVIEAYLGR